MRSIKVAGLCALLMLAGCSATKLTPQLKDSTVYRTPIDGATAQLVLTQEFQQKLITQKPSYGRAWSVFNFETPVGQAMSKALVSDMRSRAPNTRVGDREDGKPASIKVIANDVGIEFGVDEGNAIFWTSVSLVGLASDIVVGAKVHLTTTVSINGEPPKSVSTTGIGTLPEAYGALSKTDFGTVIGLAIDDAALKLGEQIQAEALR